MKACFGLASTNTTSTLHVVLIGCVTFCWPCLRKCLKVSSPACTELYTLLFFVRFGFVLLAVSQEVSKSLKLQLSEGADLETERTLNEKVLRSRINKVAAFTILVLLSVSGWQLALLNKFFR